LNITSLYDCIFKFVLYSKIEFLCVIYKWQKEVEREDRVEPEEQVEAEERVEPEEPKEHVVAEELKEVEA